MTADQADETYGKIAYQDDNYIVRVRIRDGLQVTIHRRDKQGEQKPRGYVLGSNMAWFKP